jgi:hypothetical protein
MIPAATAQRIHERVALDGSLTPEHRQAWEDAPGDTLLVIGNQDTDPECGNNLLLADERR